MYKIFLCFLLILISFIIISCKSRYYYLNKTQKIEKWKQNQKTLSTVLNYQIKGVLVCSLLKNKKKIHLKFFFQKINHKYYRLIFSDFIGFTNFEINLSENGECIVHDKIKNCFSWHDFEIMIEKIVNINIPCNNIPEWMLGLPGTASDFNLNIDSYLKKIHYLYKNNSFIVLYQSYYYNKMYNNKMILPKIIDIYCDDHYHFNLRIQNWIIL